MAAVALQLHAFRGDRALRSVSPGARIGQGPRDPQQLSERAGLVRGSGAQDEALKYSEQRLRPNELSAVARALASYTEPGRDRAFRWVQENYGVIRTRMPESSMARWPSYCGGCSAERLEAGKKFFSDPAHRVAGTDKAVERTAESVTDCVSLRTREGSAVAAYLRGQGSAEAAAGHK